MFFFFFVFWWDFFCMGFLKNPGGFFYVGLNYDNPVFNWVFSQYCTYMWPSLWYSGSRVYHSRVCLVRYKMWDSMFSFKYKGWIKLIVTVWYFWHGFIQKGTTFMNLQYNRPLITTFCQMFGRRRTPSARPSLLIRIDLPIARFKFISCDVPGPHSGSFTLAKRL